MWLLRTRPDLHFTIKLLCRFLKNATPQHVAIARGRPFRYLAGTPNYGIVFYPGKGNAGDGEWCLSGSCDADLAGDLKTSRSTIGGTLQLGKYGNVACRSSLEKKICTSTGQSETYACSSLGKEVIWTRHLLRDLLCPQRKPTGVQTDNDGVFKQSTKAINHATAKHYRIAQAFIRQICSTLIMKMVRVDTTRNQSDVLTKALGTGPFQTHRLAIMGPQEVPTEAKTWSLISRPWEWAKSRFQS